jgi:endonuclease G, mitochondrial
VTIALALVVALATASPRVSAAHETFAGQPTGPSVQVLQNPGFLVGYSEERRQPLWVAYRAESLKGKRLGKRPDRFEPDPRVAHPVLDGDYRRSGYTRGHLAPNYLIGKLYGRAAQHATFLLTNVSPQRARLNELVWQRLEEAEADVVAPGAVQLWVMAGPVFGAAPRRLKSGVALPEAFYRIWLDVRGDQVAALGFIVPQKVCGEEPLTQFRASVDEIERQTGLDFFHELADPQEAALEYSGASDGWRLERIDRRPARYANKFDSTCEY